MSLARPTLARFRPHPGIGAWIPIDEAQPKADHFVRYRHTAFDDHVDEVVLAEPNVVRHCILVTDAHGLRSRVESDVQPGLGARDCALSVNPTQVLDDAFGHEANL